LEEEIFGVKGADTEDGGREGEGAPALNPGPYDLFGMPVRARHGLKGRPEHVPTPEIANRLAILLAMGWDDKRISATVGLSIPTLRKHYFSLAQARRTARDRVEATNLQMLWDQAKGGNVAATKEFRRILERRALDDIDERLRDDETAAPARLGKKEAALAAAATAGRDTEWGGDLLAPTQH
jgi:hypothetical protein